MDGNRTREMTGGGKQEQLLGSVEREFSHTGEPAPAHQASPPPAVPVCTKWLVPHLGDPACSSLLLFFFFFFANRVTPASYKIHITSFQKEIECNTTPSYTRLSSLTLTFIMGSLGNI